MNATLELPNLGTVPRAWTMHRPNALAARTALALLDAGHLDNAHRPLTTDPAELVKAGLNAWLAGNARGLKLFDFTLHCFVGQQSPSGFESGKDQVTIQINATEFVRPINIGRRICKLPQPLAETALFWIEQAQRATLPIYTPSEAERYAMYEYWQCEDNEKIVIEELVAAGGKPEDFDLLTRADFDKAIPPWAANPRKRVSMESIKALAASRRGGPDVSIGRAIFTLIGALAEYRKRIDFNVGEDEQCLFPPPLGLYWGGLRGIMPRILDDFGEDVFNAGEHRDYFANVQIDDGPDLDKDLQKFLRGVEPVFPILRTLETLLSLITDRDHGK